MIDLNALGFNRTGGGGAPTPTGLCSVTLYNGNGSTQNIATSNDLTAALSWLKRTDSTDNHGLFDTVRGVTKMIESNTTDLEATVSGITAFSSTGFSLGSNSQFNASGGAYVAFSWVLQAQYLTAVVYTGTGSAQNIAHSLANNVGMMLVKRLSPSRSPFSEADWAVYHTSLGGTYGAALNSTGAFSVDSSYWNNTAPTTTQFTVGTNIATNESGATYVAYLFGEVAGLSKFGSFPSTGPTYTLTGVGFTPSFGMMRSALNSNNFRMAYKDGINDRNVSANTDATVNNSGLITLNSDGFSVLTTDSAWPNSSSTNIYALWA